MAHTHIAKADAYLKKIHARRGAIAMTLRLNRAGANIAMDYDGTCCRCPARRLAARSPRHILFALAGKLIEKFGKGRRLAAFLSGSLGIELSGTQKELLANPTVISMLRCAERA